jgi:type I restriction enzyme, R subunit
MFWPARNPTVPASRFEALIDQYNARIIDTARFSWSSLTCSPTSMWKTIVRSGRASRRNNSAIFDIFTQPEPALGPDDQDLVELVAKSLLEKLKREKLVLDRRLKERAKVAVKATIALPAAKDRRSALTNFPDKLLYRERSRVFC